MGDLRFEEVSVDDINMVYRKGYLTASEKNDLLHRKAQHTIDKMVEEAGIVGLPKLILERWFDRVQSDWDEIVKIATTADPTKSSIENLKNIGRVMWKEIDIIFAPFAALGEVSGTKAEHIALKMGASPGLAKVINIGVDVGSGFVATGKTAQSFAVGIQKAGAKAATKTAKATAAKETVEQAAKAADAVIDDALKEGLKAEGVAFHGLEGFVEEGAQQAAKAVKALTPQEQFVSSYEKFLREMKKVTDAKAHEVTLKEAEKLGLSLDDLRNIIPGKALNEREMAAYLKALDGPTDELINLAQRTLANEAGMAEALSRKLMDFFEFSPKFRGAEVTAGRSVEILKETPPMKAITNMLAGWDPQSIAKGDFRGAMQTIAEDIAALADEPGKLKSLQVQGKNMMQSLRDDWWPMARSLYTNLLLARPITQVRNFLGNIIGATTHAAERETAGWLSIDKAKGVASGEGVHEFQGMMAALANGMKAWGTAYKNLSPDDVSKLDFVPRRLPGAIGRILSAPGDTLIGMDRFFKEIARNGDRYAMALRKGTQQGLKGDELANYAATRAAAPTLEMMRHADDVALAVTYQSELGSFGKKAQRFLQAGPLALWFPFMRTPINLVKWGWNRTPGLQLISKSLYDDILAGGERADMAIARLTLSNMAGQFIFGLAQEGILTGGGPSDAALRRSWFGDKQPYSILGKDGWFPISNVAEPGTTPIELVADFAEIMNQLDDPTAEQTAGAITLSISRDIFDNSWWRTMGDLVDVVGSVKSGEGVNKKLMRVGAAPLVNVLTGGPLGASFARTSDPVRRETRTFLDELRARVPGYSKELPPMRDGYGDPILPPQSLGPRWVGIGSPLTFRPQETDEIKKEGARLQVKIPPWSDSLSGTKQIRDDFDIQQPIPGERLPVGLSQQEKDRKIQIFKNILRHPEIGMKTTLLESPEYKNAKPAMQRELFMDWMGRARSSAEDALLIENTGLAERAINAQAEKYLPMVGEEEQVIIQEQTQEAIDLFESATPEARENLSRWGILAPETEGEGLP